MGTEGASPTVREPLARLEFYISVASESAFDMGAKVANCVLDLAVLQRSLNCAQVAGGLVDG